VNLFAVSVVITTCNRPALLRRAVHSVLSERIGGPRVEIIVVDDASALAPPVLTEPDLVFYRMPVNGGPGPARMQGLQLAGAPWVLMLDDDDILRRGALRALVDELDRCDFTAFPVIQFARSNGSVQGGYRLVDIKDYLGGVIQGDFTPIFNRAVILRTGLQYPANRAGGEHLLWWRLAADYGIPTFDRVLVEVMDDAGERLTHTASQIRKAAEHRQLA
jgi:glycosyltransferase involved in cell wall biosynthesis